MTKNSDSDKYKHSGYGIRFNALSQFWLWNVNGVKMLLFLELVIVLTCMLIIGQKILGEGATDGLDDNTVPGEAKYLIVFNKSKNLFKSVLQ